MLATICSRLLAVLLVSAAVPAQAQVTVREGVTSQQVGNFLNQMQGMLANGGAPGMTPEQQRKLQQGILASRAHGCVEAQVGSQPMKAFMDKVNVAGRDIEALCKQGRAEEARTLSLATLNTHHNDPVAVAGKRCYQQFKPELLPLLTPQEADDVSKYERWVYDPDMAAREATPRDICKGSPTVQAAPAAPVVSAPTAPTAPTVQPPSQVLP